VFVALATLFLGSVTARVSAQGTPNGDRAAALPSTDDKTGTNPLNIQTTVVVVNDFRSLPDALFSNTSRYRYVMPLARRRMSAWLDLPILASNVTGRTEAAFGDLGVRWSWIPWIQRSRGVLVGVDTAWRTATNEALGDGRHTLAPFVQMVFLPSPATVTGASYMQRQSVGGDSQRLDISEGVATFYLAWLPTAAMWTIAEPQMVVDYENDDTSGRIDVELGRVLFGGVGTYVRPGLGIGSRSARPFDWKLEIGFRVIP